MDPTTIIQRLTKIDYLDGLGVAVGSHGIGLAYMTKRLLQVNLKASRTAPFTGSRVDRAGTMTSAARDFIEELGTVPDQVVLCLPREEASVSRLVVPGTARESLAQVIKYEVERLLPFPADGIYYDYLTTKLGGADDRLSVVVYCFPRQVVDPLVEALTKVGFPPQVVTMSSAAQSATLLACSPPETQRQLLAVADAETLELTFLSGDRLVASQTLDMARARDAENWENLLARTFARNFPGAASDSISLFAWDQGRNLPVTTVPGHDLRDLITRRFPDANIEGESSETCSALGAAFQAVGEGAEVNVLPMENRARREKLVSPLTLSLVGCLLILALVLAVGVVVKGRLAVNDLANKIDALAPTVRQVHNEEEVAARANKQLETISEATKVRMTPLLGNLSELVPTNVYLTLFRFRNGEVEVSGLAKTGSASDLVATLEGSECFENVSPKAPFTKNEFGESFRLGARVNPCS